MTIYKVEFVTSRFITCSWQVTGRDLQHLYRSYNAVWLWCRWWK